MPPAPEHDAPSAHIGRYEVLRKIATGGMAELFLAKQVGMEGFEKVVAIKRILSHIAYDDEFINMFRDEARIVAKLNHPNIVQIYDLGKSEDTYFIAMEYIPGRNLSSVAKKSRALGRRLPPEYIARCLAQACEGLYYAHTRRDMDGRDLEIIHRDVSPQNIIVSFSGSVKLVDFGIAKAASKVAHTRAGVLKGKYAYMSPEQIRGETIDARSDLFSVGIVLYELLCGRRPFEKESSIQTLKAIVQEAPVPPRELNPDIPEALARIIDRCLTKDRAQRFGSAQDVQLALEDFVTSSRERCNNITISNWLADLFSEELSRDKGGTVVFKGVGEVILPEVMDSDAKERPPRPPIEAPSNALPESGDGRANLIEEAPIGRGVAPGPADGFTDDFTEHAEPAGEGEARHAEPALDGGSAPRSYDDDSTAFMAPPTSPAPDDLADFGEEPSFSLAIDEASGPHAPPPEAPDWAASTLGLEVPPSFPRAPAGAREAREDPWADGGSISRSSDDIGEALLQRLDSGTDFDFSEDGGDRTIAMPSLQGDEPERDAVAEDFAAAAGDAFDFSDATLASSTGSSEDEELVVGDATLAMPSVDDEDADGDRTLGADELAALLGDEPGEAAGGSSAVADEDEHHDATLASGEAAVEHSDATLAGVALEDEDEVEVPFDPAPPAATPGAAFGEEHTVRGMDEEPSLPARVEVADGGFRDDQTLAGVTSDYETSGLELPDEGAYDPLPEPDPPVPEPSAPGRPRPARGGRELGAIALEKRAVDRSAEPDAFGFPEMDVDEVLIDPALDLDAPASAAGSAADGAARDEYSALVGGEPQPPAPLSPPASGSVGSTNVPPASLSLSQVLSNPMHKSGGGAPPSSGSRLQALPRSGQSAAPAAPSRSTSLIGRQIREVVRGDGSSSPGPSPSEDGRPAPAPVPPTSFERPLGSGPLVGQPPPRPAPSRGRRIRAPLAFALGVPALAAALFFALPHVPAAPPSLAGLFLPQEPNLTIKTQPPGAAVRVNGAVQGGRTPLTISGLEPGVRYRVRLELPGHVPLEQDVTLRPEKPVIWEVKLEPTP